MNKPIQSNANNSFLSNENKAMIWQFLSDAKAFSGIPEEYFQRVKNLYETTLNEINNLNNSNNSTLIEKNKAVIAEMMNKLPYLKNSSLLRPLEEVKITVDQDFKNKQEEFISLVKHDAPSEPNFSDTTDEPLDSTVMNNMLNNMMALRERELNQVQPPPPNNISGETNETNKTNEKYVNESNEFNKSNESNESKKVSFETDFISRLKKIESKDVKINSSIDNTKEVTKDVINELKLCISNQQDIMERLNRIVTLLERN